MSHWWCEAIGKRYHVVSLPTPAAKETVLVLKVDRVQLSNTEVNGVLEGKLLWHSSNDI